MAVSISSGIIYSGSLDTPKQDGPEQVEYPFYNEGDTKTRIVRRTMWQLKRRYRPLPLNKTDSFYRDCYLVAEENHQDIGGGVMVWDRVYAAIPQPRTGYRSMVMDYPGFSAPAVPVSPVAVTIYIHSQNRIRILTGAPAFTSGDLWRIHGTGDNAFTLAGGLYNDGVNGIQLHLFGMWQFSPSPAYGSSAILYKDTARASRGAFSKVVPGTVKKNYYLPGVNFQDQIDKLVLPQKERFFTLATGADASILSDTGAALTSPSFTQYKARISAGQFTLAEDATMDRWMGNIYEVSATYVAVQ